MHYQKQLWLLQKIKYQRAGVTMTTKKAKKSGLKTYAKRRNLKKSREPLAKRPKKRKTSKDPIFVIQKHAASHLHYDFRIEYNRVLKSWAVPKGPSLNPAVKRLAIVTDDHPMSYAKFEGVIPAGNYGAGTVMVWDIGTYQNIKEKDGKPVSMRECFKRGTIEIFLHGTKLMGGFALIRTARENQWLLIKMRDEYASARKNPVNTQNKSALTDRTMTQIKKNSTND